MTSNTGYSSALKNLSGLVLVIVTMLETEKCITAGGDYFDGKYTKPASTSLQYSK